MENELYHHGVHGMKWGKRNGPPYPLDAEGKAELREQRKELGKQVKKTQEYKNNKKVNSLRARDRVLRDGRIGGIAGAAAGAALGGPTGFAVGIMGGVVVSSIASGAINTGRKMYENAKFKDMKVSEFMEKNAKPKLSNEEVNRLGKEYLEYEKKRESFSTDERKDLWEDAFLMSKSTNPKQREYGKQLAQRIEQVEKSEKTYKSPNKGQYDITFLEAIQNSEILALGDHKSMDVEYEKYKADPEYYWKVHANKLKQM